MNRRLVLELEAVNAETLLLTNDDVAVLQTVDAENDPIQTRLIAEGVAVLLGAEPDGRKPLDWGSVLETLNEERLMQRLQEKVTSFDAAQVSAEQRDYLQRLIVREELLVDDAIDQPVVLLMWRLVKAYAAAAIGRTVRAIREEHVHSQVGESPDDADQKKTKDDADDDDDERAEAVRQSALALKDFLDTESNTTIELLDNISLQGSSASTTKARPQWRHVSASDQVRSLYAPRTMLGGGRASRVEIEEILRESSREEDARASEDVQQFIKELEAKRREELRRKKKKSYMASTLSREMQQGGVEFERRGWQSVGAMSSSGLFEEYARLSRQRRTARRRRHSASSGRVDERDVVARLYPSPSAKGSRSLGDIREEEVKVGRRSRSRSKKKTRKRAKSAAAPRRSGSSRKANRRQSNTSESEPLVPFAGLDGTPAPAPSKLNQRKDKVMEDKKPLKRRLSKKQLEDMMARLAKPKNRK